MLAPHCSHPCLAHPSGQRNLSKVTSCRSLAPNPPRLSCHRSCVLKSCPSESLMTSCHLTLPWLQQLFPCCFWNILAHSCLGTSPYSSGARVRTGESSLPLKSKGNPCPSLSNLRTKHTEVRSSVTSLAFYFGLKLQGSWP